jgi:hypothetical protein
VQVAYDYLMPALESSVPMLFSPATPRPLPGNRRGTETAQTQNRTMTQNEAVQQKMQQFGTVFRLLTMSGVLSVERADMIREICSEGWVLLGCMFFLTPPMFTQYGVLLCGLIYPAGCSAILVTDKTTFAVPSQVTTDR